MGRLHDQMKRDLELKNYSPHTRSIYLACVSRFALYFHRPPGQLGDQEIRGVSSLSHQRSETFLREPLLKPMGR